jgi:hypothetical protein
MAIRSHGKNSRKEGRKMTTVELSNLPPGAVVRGFLYTDPDHVYGLGDVMEIELPTGWTIDVGWDEDIPDEPFRIVVYREYFGDRGGDFRVRDVDRIVSEVERLAADYSRSIVAIDSKKLADSEKLAGTIVADSEKVADSKKAAGTVVATL